MVKCSGSAVHLIYKPIKQSEQEIKRERRDLHVDGKMKRDGDSESQRGNNVKEEKVLMVQLVWIDLINFAERTEQYGDWSESCGVCISGQKYVDSFF